MQNPASDYSVALVPGPWEHQFIAANNSRFHAALAGPLQAPLVVLLHGFGQFWWAWRGVIPALADAGYRVAALDLRGVGASDKPPTGYDIPTRSRDVAAVIRSLGYRQATIVGHGTGGEAAWAMGALQPAVTTAVAALACPHPARLHTTFLRSLTPVARRLFAIAQVPTWPEYRLRDTDALALIFAAGRRGGMLSPGLLPGLLPDDVETFTPDDAVTLSSRNGETQTPDDAELFTADDAETLTPDDAETLNPELGVFTPEVIAKYREVIRIPFAAHTSVEAMRWIVRSAPRPDGQRYRSALRRPLGIPALQIQGGLDGFLKDDVVTADSSALYRNFTYHQIANGGHYLPEEHPELIANHLINWLKAF